MTDFHQRLYRLVSLLSCLCTLAACGSSSGTPRGPVYVEVATPGGVVRYDSTDLNSCLGKAEYESPFRPRGFACDRVARSFIDADRERSKSYFEKGCFELHDGNACFGLVYDFYLYRGKTVADLQKGREIGIRLCDGPRIEDRQGRDNRGEICDYTRDSFVESEPKDELKANDLAIKACRLGADRSCRFAVDRNLLSKDTAQSAIAAAKNDASQAYDNYHQQLVESRRQTEANLQAQSRQVDDFVSSLNQFTAQIQQQNAAVTQQQQLILQQQALRDHARLEQQIQAQSSAALSGEGRPVTTQPGSTKMTASQCQACAQISNVRYKSGQVNGEITFDLANMCQGSIYVETIGVPPYPSAGRGGTNMDVHPGQRRTASVHVPLTTSSKVEISKILCRDIAGSPDRAGAAR